MTDLKSPPHTGTGSILHGRYRLDQTIGEGGMARVYRAEDLALRRTVAVKVMRGLADGTPAGDRAHSETTLLASLSHPSLVTLYDAHVSTSEPSYLVMEYVQGPTLGARLAVGALPPSEVAALALDLAEALHVVHERGIVHRDIKPSNVLLWTSPLPDRAFRAKLTDFGIAYLLDSTRVTAPGTVIGTAAYLAPEQVRGEQPSSAADIYSLGLLLLESLTGQRAFAPALSHESVIARLTVSPTIPDDVSGGWRVLLTAMTASNPPRRPTALQVALAATVLRRADASAGEVLAVLEEPTIAAGVLADHTVSAVADPSVETAQPRVAESEPEPDLTKVLPASDIEHAVPTKRRGLIGVLIAVVALLAAGVIAVGILVATNEKPDPAPTLPAVEEPLGTHLDDLLESVTP